MNNKKELLEAKLASKNVLELIDEAQDKLKSAKGWGIFDIFAGGFFTSLIKRGKISDINVLLERIEDGLQILSKELKDINYHAPVGIGDSFAANLFDIAFDNIFTDIMVQSELSETSKKLDRLYNDVLEIDKYLEKELDEYLD